MAPKHVPVHVQSVQQTLTRSTSSVIERTTCAAFSILLNHMPDATYRVTRTVPVVLLNGTVDSKRYSATVHVPERPRLYGMLKTAPINVTGRGTTAAHALDAAARVALRRLDPTNTWTGQAIRAFRNKTETDFTTRASTYACFIVFPSDKVHYYHGTGATAQQALESAEDSAYVAGHDADEEYDIHEEYYYINYDAGRKGTFDGTGNNETDAMLDIMLNILDGITATKTATKV